MSMGPIVACFLFPVVYVRLLIAPFSQNASYQGSVSLAYSVIWVGHGADSPSTAERQTDGSKYKTSLGYAVSFRLACTKVVESYRKS